MQVGQDRVGRGSLTALAQENLRLQQFEFNATVGPHFSAAPGEPEGLVELAGA